MCTAGKKLSAVNGLLLLFVLFFVVSCSDMMDSYDPPGKDDEIVRTTADEWIQASNPSAGSDVVLYVSYGNGVYVASVGVENQIIYSVDGDFWEEATTLSFGTDVVLGNRFCNDKHIAVGQNGKIAYSSDGDTWTQASKPMFDSNFIIRRVGYFNGKFVAVSLGSPTVGGDIGYSADGDEWTLSETPSFGTSDIYGITYGNGLYVAVGTDGKIAYSNDANIWTQVATSSFGSSDIIGVTYNDSMFVAVGEDGKIAYSIE